MRICKDCRFYRTQAAQVGPNQMGMMAVCSHGECRDPVSGDPLPGGVARSNQSFCGMAARFYQERDKIPEQPVETKVVQLLNP